MYSGIPVKKFINIFNQIDYQEYNNKSQNGKNQVENKFADQVFVKKCKHFSWSL